MSIISSVWGGISARRAQTRFARAQAAVAFYNQMNASKCPNNYLMGLSHLDRGDPPLEGIDAIQALSYNPENYPHCMDVESAHG